MNQRGRKTAREKRSAREGGREREWEADRHSGGWLLQFTFACAINSCHCCCCWPLLTLTAANAVDNWHAATVVDWPWEENKEKRRTSCSNCTLCYYCLYKLHCWAASILSATCVSTSPRSSGRKLKLIWPKNAVFFSQLLCEIQRQRAQSFVLSSDDDEQ